MNLSSTWDELSSGAARDYLFSRVAFYEFAYQHHHHQYLFKCLLCVGSSSVAGGTSENKKDKNPCLCGIYSLEEVGRQ